MPRRARQLSSTGIYHVMLRGVNRATIFHDDEDNEVFLQKLEEVRREYPFDLYAWCLMGNHVHLLVRVGGPASQRGRFLFHTEGGTKEPSPGDGSSSPGVLRATVPISQVPCEIETVPYDRPPSDGELAPVCSSGDGSDFPHSCEIKTVPSDQTVTFDQTAGEIDLPSLFKRLGVRYAAWYNHKYQRTGHLFQDRFKSVPVEDDAQFLATLRYIVRNPIKAGISREPGEYLWCRYSTKLPVDVTQEQLDRYFRETDGDQMEPFPVRLTDAEAETVIRGFTDGKPASVLGGIPKAELIPILRRLQGAGLNVLQIARLTGISKSNVARWLS